MLLQSIRTGTFGDDDLARVLHAALVGSGPLTTEQLENVADWAHRVMTAAAILEGVLDGTFVLEYGDIEHDNPTVKLGIDGGKHAALIQS